MAEENACIQAIDHALRARREKIESIGTGPYTREEALAMAQLSRLHVDAMRRLLACDEQSFLWFKNNDPMNRDYLVYLVRVKHLKAQIAVEERCTAFSLTKSPADRAEFDDASLVAKTLSDVLNAVSEAIKPVKA